MPTKKISERKFTQIATEQFSVVEKILRTRPDLKRAIIFLRSENRKKTEEAREILRYFLVFIKKDALSESLLLETIGYLQALSASATSMEMTQIREIRDSLREAQRNLLRAENEIKSYAERKYGPKRSRRYLMYKKVSRTRVLAIRLETEAGMILEVLETPSRRSKHNYKLSLASLVDFLNVHRSDLRFQYRGSHEEFLRADVTGFTAIKMAVLLLRLAGIETTENAVNSNLRERRKLKS